MMTSPNINNNGWICESAVELKVATYNVQNLFLCGEAGADFTKPMAQVRPLARMIDQVDADVMVMQEVGSQGSLDALSARLEKPYKYSVVVPGNSLRSIHLAVLSRYPVALTSMGDGELMDPAGAPLLAFRSWQDAQDDMLSPVQIQRDILCCEIELAQARFLTLFAVHLKSRTNPSWQVLAADDVRRAECRRLVNSVAAYRDRYPHRDLMVLGDFNDTENSAALASLGDLALLDCHAERLKLGPRRKNPSTYWPKRGMRIDRMLLSPDTASRVELDSAQIHASNMAKTASDHYPVSLVIDYPEIE